MATASIYERKARLSAFLDLVRDGDEVLVTDRGRPIARLTPIQGEVHDDGRREMLLRSGRMRGPTAALANDVWTRPRPADATGRSLALLLEERDESR